MENQMWVINKNKDTFTNFKQIKITVTEYKSIQFK